MTTRSNGPLAGFDWLHHGVNVGYLNPKAILGGAALILLMTAAAYLLTLLIQVGGVHLGKQPDMLTIGLITVLSTLSSLLLVPLNAGYLQVIDAAERGLPARARDIFQPYRRGDALRLMGYGLAMFALYSAAFGIVIVATGGGIARWYLAAMAAQLHHLPPPPVADGFGMAVALLMLAGLFVMGAHAISLGQVALRHRPVFAAIGDGVAGALKNVLPLLVFAISMLVGLVLFVILIVLLAGLLTVLGKLVGTWLVLLLVIPLYVAVMVALGAGLSGTLYYLWRDVCGDDDGTPIVAQSIAA